MKRGAPEELVERFLDPSGEEMIESVDPAAYIDDWATLDPRQQQALLNNKWPGDIARQQEQLEILHGILGSR